LLEIPDLLLMWVLGERLRRRIEVDLHLLEHEAGVELGVKEGQELGDRLRPGQRGRQPNRRQARQLESPRGGE
jgi:hypothetical protein